MHDPAPTAPQTKSVKVGKATANPCLSTIGTPQGDGLSPVLFICYLEAALHQVRANLPERPFADRHIPGETGYADDVTLYSTSEDWLNRSLPIISAELGDWSLTVNETKTEFLHLTSSSDSWRSSRQLGSLISNSEDLERTKDLTSSAYGRMYSLWLRRGKVSEQRCIRLYNALVLPVPLYNCGAWGLTVAQAESLNAFHRKQIQRLIGIVNPARMSNTELHERCNTEPLSDIVDRRRWQL